MINKGQLLNSRYEIIKSIGEGGMANVYLAYDNILKREVAVKVLRGDLASDDKFVRRFQREALSASSLSHPNIIEVYDVGDEDGKYYIVMEYVTGKNLKTLLKKRGALSLPEVIDIMLQLTDGLATAHENYIIHRDIKPQNIILQEDGHIKITDFGIAMALNSIGLTQTNSVMGTVHYLPPEQASGKGSTTKSDIYSLGILMYELLTGSVPFKGENPVEIALKHMREPMPHVRDYNEEIPQSIENIILISTAKNPKNRYANAREMHDDIVTSLEESRIDEEPIVFEFTDMDESQAKNKTILESEEVVAKKVVADDTKVNKWMIGLVAFGSALLLSIIVYLIVVFIPGMNKVEDIKIPDYSNQLTNEVESSLEKLGLSFTIVQASSEDIEDGYVIKTDPSSGSYVKKGATIKVYVSTGSNLIEIENYIGQNAYEVKGRLEALGLNVFIEKKSVSTEDAKKYDKDEIIDQKPENGYKLGKGDSITLYVPNIVTEYPDMVAEKWTEQEARSFADAYGVSLNVEYKETDNYEEGTVIGQSRPAGSEVVAGVKFTITVAIAPNIPDVIIDENDLDKYEQAQ